MGEFIFQRTLLNIRIKRMFWKTPCRWINTYRWYTWIKVSIRYLWGWEGGFQSRPRRPAGRRPAARASGTPWGERREERGETGDPPELQTPFTTGQTPPPTHHPALHRPAAFPGALGNTSLDDVTGWDTEPKRKERIENLEKVGDQKPSADL